MVEDVGGLFGDPLVGLFAGGADDLLGLLLDLFADQGRVTQELDRVAALGPLGASALQRPLQRRERLVDDAGINLAGVQRLLSIAEVVQRIRPLMRDEPMSAREARRLAQEIDELTKMLGLD